MQMVDDNDDLIASLVAKAQAGDQVAVGTLFDLLSDRIFRFLRLRTADTETAEDLTQTVFLEMIQALPRYERRPNTKFTTWLFQIARFRLIDHYRQHRPNVSLEQIPEPSEDPLGDRDPLVAGRVEAALRQLSEKYQTVLHLRFREELPASDVARIMKTTAINVRVIQHRALRALRTILTQNARPSRP